MHESSSDFQLSDRALRTGAQPISYLMAQAIQNPNLISLAAGLVDYDTLPSDETAAIVQQLLVNNPKAKLPMQYGTTHGHAQLRQLLLEHLARLDGVHPSDLDASPDDIIITTGSQQLLFMLTDVLVNPGDIVITGWPSYFVYTGTLTSFGAQVRCVDVDEQGMIPEKLESLLSDLAKQGQLKRVKIVYIVDYHDNPTGITLSADRRPRILDIVKRYSAQHRILLLEDAAYRELTYEGDPPPSIKKFDEGNRHVALVQTFSKPFAPGFKTGYGLLPRELVEPVVNQKGNHDFGSSNLNQTVLLAALQSGVYAEHVKRLCRRYAAKRNAMLEAMEEHLGDFATGETHWTKPTGGLYVFLTLPQGIDTGRDSALFSRAVAEGVLYVPGEYCFSADPTRAIPTHTMRLSFGVASTDHIREGIARLARAIKATPVAAHA